MLAGCTHVASMRAAAAKSKAGEIAAAARLAESAVVANNFKIRTYRRGPVHDSVLMVYVEGDGHAWSAPRRAAIDPTPIDPLVLRLAARDPSPSVLYLGRPCQYLDPADLNACDSRYWTSDRYASAVVDALNQVIDDAISGHGKTVPVALVGYSGGGTLAALIAARRHDVRFLVTIAANLDHRLWTRLHRVSALEGSLNAADEAAAIRHIPQLHFVGTDDRIVPRAITESFMRRQGAATNSRIVAVKGFDHQCCWAERWPALVCGEISAWETGALLCR